MASMARARPMYAQASESNFLTEQLESKLHAVSKKESHSMFDL